MAKVESVNNQEDKPLSLETKDDEDDNNNNKQSKLQFNQFNFQPKNAENNKNGTDIKNIKELSQISFKELSQNLSDEMYADTKEKYECIEIFQTEQNAEQKALFQVLTAGRKHHTPQLLSLFVSDYSRWRIKQFYRQNFKDENNDDYNTNSPSNQTKFSTDIWGQKSKIVNEIVNAPVNSGIPSLQATITSAVDTHSKRLSPFMDFRVLDEHKIDDSLGWFAQNIMNGIALIKNENWKPPCQLDIWIIPRKIGYVNKDNDDEQGSEDDDDEDLENMDSSDDDSDPDYPAANDVNDSKEGDEDEYNLKHIGKRIEESIDEKYRQKYNNFAKLKRRFLQQINNETQNKRYCMIVRRDAKSNDISDIIDNDDTKSDVEDDENKNGEEIHMFRPKKYNEIPKYDIPEWGIQAALKDILPSNKDKEWEAITGKETMKGNMFLLSLQKTEQEEIRAWLFNRGTYTRFYPNDILNVLPFIFARNKQNQFDKKQFQTLTQMIEKNPIPDKKFDGFTGRKHNETKLISFDQYEKIQ